MTFAGHKHTAESRAKMSARWTPELREAFSLQVKSRMAEQLGELARQRMADDAFRTQCGFLHAGERDQIIAACRSGRPYLDIAADWLIHESHVCKIAIAAGIHRQGPDRTMKCARRRYRAHREITG